MGGNALCQFKCLTPPISLSLYIYNLYILNLIVPFQNDINRMRRLNWNCWHKNWEHERQFWHMEFLEWHSGLSLAGRSLWTCSSLVHAKAKNAAFPLIFLLYNLHVVSKCLTLPTKCCKNLSFDLTDGAHAPRERSNSPNTIPPILRVSRPYRFSDQTCSSSFTHMTS